MVNGVLAPIGYAPFSAFNTYFKWLTRQNVLLWNPASELELPRQEKRLPKHVLTVDEAERVMAIPDVGDAIGLRDRAILETLYSTGIRRMEVMNLLVYDVDAERGTLMVRQGKGKKDRMVPIGERAVACIARYVSEARGQLVMPPDEGVLFLTQEGESLTPNRLTQLVRDYVNAAETGKSGACHLFRHTCATLMLEGGADIRYIQEMLGHVELSTTQIYTQVSIRRLKAVHALTHPSAKLDRPTKDDAPDGMSRERVETTPSLVASPAAPQAVTAADLLATLDAEADEEHEEELGKGRAASTSAGARSKLDDDAATAQGPREEGTARARRADGPAGGRGHRAGTARRGARTRWRLPR
ncbi:MAG TPA: tyrosine-type recombinase/integrase [Polyangiaceae bacterium]|nr:tyrosine-type recombinase/integrase [Polyangiaceae bacterium]